MAGDIATRHEFLSTDWFAALRASLATRVAERREDLAGIDFTVCEVFTNCPPDGRTVGHWFRFREGELEYGDGEAERADFRLDAEHSTVIATSKAFMRSPEFPGLVEAAVATGKFRPTSMDDAPRVVRRLLADVHDDMVRATR
jgi:hypothetical protein